MNEVPRSDPFNDPSMPPEAKRFVPPEPNPVTMARHRHEVFMQITLPVILLVIIFLVMVVLAWAANSMQASLWADISLVFLSVLLAVMLLLGIAALAGIAYLVIYLNKSLPPYTRLVQDYTEQAGHYARVAADKSVAPILQTQSVSASLRALRSGISRLGKSDRA